MSSLQRPQVSIDILSSVELEQIFHSVGEYLAVHDPVLDEFGSVLDARLIWWNKQYESLRRSAVEANSRMSHTYVHSEIALEYAKAAWSSGRSTQLFELTPDTRSQYRSTSSSLVLSVLWQRVGNYIIEVGSDLSERRRLEERLTDRQSLVFASERDRLLLEDRERIARNLHDTVIQQMYASSLGLNAVARRLGLLSEEPNDVHERLRSITQTIADDLSSLIATIRDEIFAVRQDPKSSLRRELEDVVLPIIGPSTMEIEFRLLVDSIQDDVLRGHLRSMVREAVSNSVRHSQGSRVTVDVHTGSEGWLHAAVIDDGVGLPHPVTRSEGMNNIEERARAMGGSVEFAPNERGGTTVVWHLPLPEIDA